MNLDIEGANLENEESEVAVDSIEESTVAADVDDRKQLVVEPKQHSSKRNYKRCCCYCSLVLLAILIIICLALAWLVFYYMPDFLQKGVFEAEESRAVTEDFTIFDELNSLSRNFYLQLDGATTTIPQDVGDQWPSLGVWHILPHSVSERLIQQNTTTSKDMVESLKEGNESVLLFFHGHGANRSNSQIFFNWMSNMDFHVLVLDYRGFGDSTGRPTELGVNADARTIFDYAHKRAPNKDIIIFGHSLGTGIATWLAFNTSNSEISPKALILAGAFNNLHDAVVHFSRRTAFNPSFPFFENILRMSMSRDGLEMPSDRLIKKIDFPSLLIANVLDTVIPIQLSRKLADAGKSANRTLTFVELNNTRVGHMVHLADETPEIVRKFLKR
ncbi:serine aminopeptidase, s33 domain-containing protein [Ditylenchus destructor]|nr:serine aminopeptidase, s33 domain-containing protein [Ditylenchus destructor]